MATTPMTTMLSPWHLKRSRLSAIQGGRERICDVAGNKNLCLKNDAGFTGKVVVFPSDGCKYYDTSISSLLLKNKTYVLH